MILYETSQRMRAMSFLCALLVVAIHVPWPHGEALSLGWFFHNLLAHGIGKIAVPYFFILFGYFLAGHFDEPGWWARESRKRFMSLAVPFLIWTIISYIVGLMLSVFSDLAMRGTFNSSLMILKNSNWAQIFGLDLTKMPHLFPLWFLRSLLLFSVVAFAYKWLVLRLGVCWLIISFGFLLTIDAINNDWVRELFRVGFPASGIFYVSSGIFFRCYSIRSKILTPIAALIVGGGAQILKLLLVYKNWPYVLLLDKLSIPFLLYWIWSIMRGFSIHSVLTSCAFPIYLMHPIVFAVLGVTRKRIFLPEMVFASLQYVFGVIICIGVTIMLRRLMPQVALFVFGNRK